MSPIARLTPPPTSVRAATPLQDRAPASGHRASASAHRAPASGHRAPASAHRAGRAAAASLVGLLVAVGVAGCGGGADGGRRGTSFVQGDGSFTLVAESKRQQPIALAGDTLDGEQLDVASLRGKPVVLNVWGSWCGPCKTEAPELEAASKQLSRVGVRMIGINTKDNVAQAKAHERTYGVTYPSLVDTGALLLALRGAVPPDAIPSTLVLDAQGRIAARISGAVTRATLLDVFTDATGVQVPEGSAG